jgi:tripartite tricarboxylate transporter TctB family protein
VFASGLSQEEMFSRQGIGPGFMPVVTGLALSAIAAADVFRALIRRPDPPAPGETSRADVYRVVAIGGALVVFTLVLGWIGYRLAMTALLVAVVLVIDRKAWVAAGVTGLVGGFGVAVLFERVLGLYLPLAAVEPLAGLGF